ncbi:hypothetical protein D9M68_845680 [compost metagenome]
MRLSVEFRLQVRILRTAGATTLRAAGLGHEAFDHAVEHDAVIKAFARQLLDMGDMVRRQVGAHLDDDIALGGFDDEGVFRIGVFGHFCNFRLEFVARM